MTFFPNFAEVNLDFELLNCSGLEEERDKYYHQISYKKKPWHNKKIFYIENL